MAVRYQAQLVLTGLAVAATAIVLAVTAGVVDEPAQAPGVAADPLASGFAPASSAATDRPPEPEPASPDATQRRPVPPIVEAVPPEAERLLARALEAKGRDLRVVLAEVLIIAPKLTGWDFEGRTPLREAEHVWLCIFADGERSAPRSYQVRAAIHDPSRSARRHGCSMPLGKLAVGDVRQMVLAGPSRRGEEPATLIWAGPLQPQPYDDVTAAMPKRLFADLERGASVFQARVRAVSWRLTAKARQRLGFPARITVIEVEVLAVVQSEEYLAPSVVVHLDLLPVLPALRGMRAMLPRLPSSDIDPERVEVGAVTWFAAERIWASLSVLRAMP